MSVWRSQARLTPFQCCREYIESVLPSFKQRHPDVEVVTVKRRNQFPLVKAEYCKSKKSFSCVYV